MGKVDHGKEIHLRHSTKTNAFKIIKGKEIGIMDIIMSR